jgi:hypothetical protein
MKGSITRIVSSSMKTIPGIIITAIFITALTGGSALAQNNEQINTGDTGQNRISILWTSGDPAVAEHVVMPYSLYSKKAGWFDEVRLIVWGPSSKLLSESEVFQKKIAELQEAGVKVEACLVCADSYGVSDQFREMGIEVIPMGKPLSDRLKSDGDWKVITF